MSQMNLHQVKQLADQLSFDEKRALIEHIAKQLQQVEDVAEPSQTRKPQDLYGSWRGCFPDELDVELALNGIRHEWEKEWPEIDTPWLNDEGEIKEHNRNAPSAIVQVSSRLQD